MAALGFLILWFLYIERAILTPFVLAAIFAYIFNPFVSYLSNKLKLPRVLSVIVIYLLIVGVVVTGGIALTRRIVDESSQFESYIDNIVLGAKQQIDILPEWVKPTIKDAIFSIDKSKLLTFSPSILAFFPEVFSRLISFIIFLFSAFYFLKEGRSIIDRFLNFIPGNYRIEVEILLRKINSVLGGYLRGQLFVVFFMSTLFFIVLSVFNIKFALILAIFSGIAEIIPFIGPIIATTLAGIVAFTSGASSFGFNPLQTALAVVGSYIVVRQIGDLLVTPLVYAKVTKLHPLIILFAVLAGGHLLGFLGLILGVPIAATLRILLEYSFDRISSSERKK